MGIQSLGTGEGFLVKKPACVLGSGTEVSLFSWEAERGQMGRFVEWEVMVPGS